MFDKIIDKHALNKTSDKYEGTFHQYVRVQRRLENQKSKSNLPDVAKDKKAKDKEE